MDNRDFVTANKGLLLSWGLMFLLSRLDIDSIFAMVFVFELFLFIPFWCLCYCKANVWDALRSIAVMLIVSIFVGLVFPFLLNIERTPKVTRILLFIVSGVIVVFLGYIIKKKKFFESFWFSIQLSIFSLLMFSGFWRP